MKQVILSSVLFITSLCTISTTAKAQKGFYVGVQGAPQLSVMFNEDDVKANGSDYKSKFSQTYGVTGGYNFTSRMGIGTEVMYSTSKQRYTAPHASYTQQFSYVKVPLLFTYNSNPESKVVFTAKAGPQVGLLVKSKITNADDASLNGDNKDKYRDMVFGATAGAGARVRLAGNIYLHGGVRFDGSFSNIENKDHHGYTSGRAKTYDLNTGIEFGLKYFLN
jgi:hypothetical protein